MIRQHVICWDVDVLETDDIIFLHFFGFAICVGTISAKRRVNKKEIKSKEQRSD